MKKTTVEVMEFSIKEVVIPIVGISPLIVHAWSEKSKKMITDKQAGKAKNKKHEIRNPEEDYEQAKHIINRETLTSEKLTGDTPIKFSIFRS